MHPSIMLLRASMAIFLLRAVVSEGIAQTPPWALNPDTVQTYRIGSPHNAVPAGSMAQSYSFEMVYDSICHVHYLFTEFWLNGQVLNLAHWQDRRLVEGNAAYLTFNSHTFTFPVHAGDTISFYRELEWYHPFTHWQDTNNYYALGTLEFIAHLVRASDGTPLAQMDSTGIMPRTTIGAPWIYGGRQLMAIVSYVVPSAVQGDSAFIGVTVHANGSGKYNFTRLDGYTIGMSNRLKRAEYQRYLDVYSPSYAKRVTGDFAQPGDERFALTVVNTAGSARDIAISFSEPEGTAGRVSVAVYDMSGALLFSPYASNANAGTQTVRYRTPGSGTYFVALLSNERIVRTCKVIVD